MQDQHTNNPALTAVVRCILRDVSRSSGHPLDDLPDLLAASDVARILRLTTTRTLDVWAGRPDRNGLAFLKVGRHRRYALSDVVAHIARRRESDRPVSDEALMPVVLASIERLGSPVGRAA